MTTMLSARQIACWKSKINYSSATESELCINAGPSAFQLQESMLKNDKICCRYLMINCVRLRTFWTPLVGIYSLLTIELWSLNPRIDPIERTTTNNHLLFCKYWGSFPVVEWMNTSGVGSCNLSSSLVDRHENWNSAWWHKVAHFSLSVDKKIGFFIIQDGGRPPFWEKISRHNSRTVWLVIRKLARWHALAFFTLWEVVIWMVVGCHCLISTSKN